MIHLCFSITSFGVQKFDIVFLALVNLILVSIEEYLPQSASTTILKQQNHRKQHAEKPSRLAFFETAGHPALL